MSLGLRSAELLQKKLKLNEAETQPGKPPATQLMNLVESDQVTSYFLADMRKHELDQASMNAGRSTFHHPEP